MELGGAPEVSSWKGTLVVTRGAWAVWSVSS